MKALTGSVAVVALALVVLMAVLVAVIQTITSDPPILTCGIDTTETGEEADMTPVSDRLTLDATQAANARLILGIASQQLATTETAAAMVMRSIGRSGLLNLSETGGLLGLEPLAYPAVNVLDKAEAINAYLTNPAALTDVDEQWAPEAGTIVARWANSPTNPTACTNDTDATAPVTADDIVSVRGIQVHRDIAAELSALLAAAEADGFRFSGWGWRSHQRQHELRRINGCRRNGGDDGSWTHSDDEDPSTWVPSSRPWCVTPTARPGFSNHESGRAIDFTYQGRTIGSRRSPAFRWLASNAGRYGLINLPSEPWHWSTNGR